MERVGFIGLGLMGKPMAKNLLRHGFKMAVFNRSKAPMEELASLGATPCSSSKEVAESSECVITMLPDEKAVEQVLLGRGGVLEGLAPGCVVVDMSTVSPGFSREMARRVEEKGGEMLDAPVSGSTMAAEQGALTIMVGGKPETFEKIRPVFEAMGKNIHYMGGAGMGSFTKLCNQVAVSLNLLGVCETLMVAAKAGLDLRKVIEVISTGAGGSWQLSNLGPRMVMRDFRPGFKVKHLRKDLRILRETTESLGLCLPGVALVSELVKTLDEMGHGENGTQALVEVLEKLCNIRIG
ncbi:MAG: NAD(P)-dependent oxidoreductase [Aigarchaeota archaeon]|jgi:3-hydroxyisobutyrate dehydrogenase|nr:NAD(P)-dependent oxidoreductase [Candidatus Caldarchaeales archaeon]MDJ0273497.1 NAD(P)-dependent oxidoreductase [Candidatus Caldarchaeales archaeon]